MPQPSVFNFSAGPAMLPPAVIEQVQQELPNWNGLGISVMEISHRDPRFMQLGLQIEQDFRELLQISNDYSVLFLPAGGRGQFSMVPMNLQLPGQLPAYCITGVWGKLACEEAKTFSAVNVVCDTTAEHCIDIPDQSCWGDFSEASYLHYVDNETVNGIEFVVPPDSASVALVSDMSSNILSRAVDINRFGLIYACAQKNLGPAGVTVVIVRNDLLQRAPLAHTPCMYRYANHVKEHSLYNTPPVFPWYVCGLVMQWVKQEGGVEEMDRRARQRSQALYQYIDGHEFYANPVNPSLRSRMNVVFTLANPHLESDFVAEAEQAGLIGLKGHRFVGGLRASLYNAMPMSGVTTLIDFMDHFAARHG